MVQIQPKREYRHKGQRRPMSWATWGRFAISNSKIANSRIIRWEITWAGSGVELAWSNFSGANGATAASKPTLMAENSGQMDHSVLHQPGGQRYLTLDHRLQQDAEARLEGKIGAIVVLHSRIGQDPGPGLFPPTFSLGGL